MFLSIWLLHTESVSIHILFIVSVLHLAKLDFSLQERRYTYTVVYRHTYYVQRSILQVLLAFSGGMSSRVLLGLAEEVIYIRITCWLGYRKVVCHTGTEIDCV